MLGIERRFSSKLNGSIGSLCKALHSDPDLPVEHFRSGRSPQDRMQWKVPFVTPKRCGHVSGRFELGPVREETMVLQSSLTDFVQADDAMQRL